jgi:hypothetical protein
MIWEQEIRNALFYLIQMAAIRTFQRPLTDMRLQEERVQILEELRVCF